MESQVGPPSTSGQPPPPRASAKASIQYLCSLLALLGVRGLVPETLRQAKFDTDDEGVRYSLWRALHDLALSEVAGWPRVGVGTEEEGPEPAGPAPLEALWEDLELEGAGDAVPDAVARLVKHYLAHWGYRGHGLYAATASGASTRGLLLAFGWLLVRCRVFDRGLQRLLEDYTASEMLPPFPDDPATLGPAAQAATAGREEVREQVRAMKACLDGLQGWARVDMLARHAAMLLTRTRAAMADVAALQSARRQLAHEILQCQVATLQAMDPPPRLQPGTQVLTAYELTLCRSAGARQAHMTALTAAQSVAERREAAARHAAVMFAWLESVEGEAGQVHGHTFGDNAFDDGQGAAQAGSSPHAELASLPDDVAAALANVKRLADRAPSPWRSLSSKQQAVQNTRWSGAIGMQPSRTLAVHDVEALQEARRLRTMLIDVAKQLSRVRAENKRKLMEYMAPYAENNVVLGF